MSESIAPGFDVYALRPEPPAHWSEEMRAWGRQILLDGRPPLHLGDELTDEQALDWWMPLPFASLMIDGAGNREIVMRELFAGQPGVLLVWVDGSVHSALPPRKPSDLLHLYRFSRIILEAYAAEGQRLFLRDLVGDDGDSELAVGSALKN